MLAVALALVMVALSAESPAQAASPFGDFPLVNYRFNDYGGEVSLSFNVYDPSALGTDNSAQISDCGELGIATIQLSGPKIGTHSRTSKPGCKFTGTKSWVSVRGGLRANYDYDRTSGSQVWFHLRNRAHHNVSKRVYWRIRMSTPAGIDTNYSTDGSIQHYSGGAETQSGSVLFRSVYHKRLRTRRIYETSFDNYMNICINGNHQLRASGGKLYCQIEGHSAYWDDFAKHSPMKLTVEPVGN